MNASYSTKDPLVKTIKVLLDAGADPNAQDKVLFILIIFYLFYFCIISLLILCLKYKVSPLHLACIKKNTKAVELLLAAGADPNSIAGVCSFTYTYYFVKYF